jgi:hypothetical protein
MPRVTSPLLAASSGSVPTLAPTSDRPAPR